MTKKDPYRDFVTSKAMELGEETGTHTQIEVRGGWILFIAENEIIKRTHGYYDMNRYMTEHWNDLTYRLQKLSEARRLMEEQLEDEEGSIHISDTGKITVKKPEISEKYLIERIEKGKARLLELKSRCKQVAFNIQIFETKLANMRGNEHERKTD